MNAPVLFETPALLLLVIALTHGNTVNAQSLTDEGWQLAFDKDNIQVHSRSSPKSGLVETLTLTTIDATPKRVFSVITDFANYPKFMPHIIEARVVKRENDTLLIFQRIRISNLLRYLFKDRYHVITIRLFYPDDAGNHFRVEWTLNVPATQKLQLDSAIATPINTGYWDLQGVNGGKSTQIKYYIHTDPGGSIPKYFANTGVKQSIPMVIRAVREQLMSLQHQQSSSQ